MLEHGCDAAIVASLHSRCLRRRWSVGDQISAQPFKLQLAADFRPDLDLQPFQFQLGVGRASGLLRCTGLPPGCTRPRCGVLQCACGLLQLGLQLGEIFEVMSATQPLAEAIAAGDGVGALAG